MIDYDLTKIRAFVFDVDGVLSPATIAINERGEPVRMVNIKDGYAIQLAVKRGFKVAIITGSRFEAVRLRYNMLGVTDIFTGAAVKLPVLKEWLERNGLAKEETVFCGDDLPDLPCMDYVGLAVAPADAVPEAHAAARYICPRDGGYGVARDVIEQVMKAQGVFSATEPTASI